MEAKEKMKIQCPHCRTINEANSLNDICQKCGTILGAPVTALDSGKGAPTSKPEKGEVTSGANKERAAGTCNSVREWDVEARVGVCHNAPIHPDLIYGACFALPTGGLFARC